MIRRDDLQHEGLVLYQDDALPRFDADAVHLAHFLRLRRGERAIDLGCGTGVLCVLGAAFTGAAFTGVDIEPRLVALARRSAKENGQDIAFLTLDARDAPARLGHGAFDAAVCERDMDTGAVLLGDMMISVPRCQAQGEEFGHGYEREIMYLTVHSVLHLLGYDHVDEGEMKRAMRAREKAIMGDD